MKKKYGPKVISIEFVKTKNIIFKLVTEKNGYVHTPIKHKPNILYVYYFIN